MRFNFKYLAIIIISCSIFSCNNNPTKEVEDVKEIVTNTETGSMRCTINGQLNKMDTAAILPYGGDESMQTCFASNREYQIEINFPKALAVGQSTTTCTAVVSRMNVIEQFREVKSITLSITKKTKEKIGGTFSFTLFNADDTSKIITVTDGEFESNIINIQL
jgi:hypothetical protein